MILSEAIKILEANGLGAEITNKTFRKYMERFGLGGVHLLKGDGYLYFVTDDKCDPDIKDYIDGLDSTSIYMNSFGEQSPQDWASMIWDMTYGRKEKEEEEAKERANAPKVFKIPRLKLQAPANEIAEDANAHIHWVKTVVKNNTIYVKIRPSEFDSYLHDLNYWANVNYKKEDFEMTMLSNLGESVNEDFGIGVGAPLGADQGIPMGGDMKAVVAYRMDGGRPACRCRCCGKKLRKKKKARR